MRAGLLLGAAFFLLLARPGSPPAEPLGPGGGWVRVPKRGVDVYVPLDPALRPVLPPGAAADWGFLSLDVQPDAAAIAIDGRPAGPAARFRGPDALVALPPGRHHVEVRLDASRALVATVEIVPRQTYPLRLEWLGAGASPAPGGGYHVVPR